MTAPQSRQILSENQESVKKRLQSDTPAELAALLPVILDRAFKAEL